jgi:transcriptional regulator with XRE-family HTH domain
MAVVGAKIASLREAHGVSAADVAAAAGISRGYLSRLENGHQIPSLVILDAIVQQFGVGLGYLFEASSKSQVAVQKGIDKLDTQIPDEASFAYEALCTQRPHKLVDPFLATFRPNSRTKVAAHDAEYFRYVIDGRLVLHYADQQYEIQQGDSIYYDATEDHEFECLGEVAAKALTLYVKDPPFHRGSQSTS